jgi:hypothetical protein
VKLDYVLCSLGLLVCLAVGSRCGTVYGREMCETTGGVRFCVEMKGQCDLYHLLPREKVNIKMDMFHIAILNCSNRSIKIVPEYFCGVTAEGRIVVIDPPFYESIEFKTKLRTREIEPQQQVDGFLFFPASSGLIRSLVYSQDPFIEMLLY